MTDFGIHFFFFKRKCGYIWSNFHNLGFSTLLLKIKCPILCTSQF